MLPISNHVLIVDIRSTITRNISLRPNTRDIILWNGQGNVLLSTVWHTLNETRGKWLGWYSILWNKFHVPRFSFLTCAAIYKRLSTADRLNRFGIAVDVRHSSCNSENASYNHLFLYYQFSWQIRRTMLTDLGSSANSIRNDIINLYFYHHRVLYLERTEWSKT